MTLRARAMVLAGVSIFLVCPSGCSSGSSDSSSSGGACERAYKARCKRACECQPGPECTFAGGVIQNDGGTTLFLTTVIKNEEACNLFVTTECANGGDPAGDYPVCEEKSKTAACIDVPIDGGTLTGVEPIAECNFN